jgi:hypothetical protein
LLEVAAGKPACRGFVRGTDPAVKSLGAIP